MVGSSGETWRYLDLGRQGPYENASVMPVLARHEHPDSVWPAFGAGDYNAETPD